MQSLRVILLLRTLVGRAGQRAPAPPAAAGASPPVPVQAPMGMPQTRDEWAHGAQRFERLGDVHRRVSSSSEKAHDYFDRRFRFMWGFNHDEAIRSFARAAQLDPHRASCYWAVALTVGPTYNLSFLTAKRAHVGFEALKSARAEVAGASPVEQALIAALAARYPDDRPLDAQSASAVLQAYASAMRQVAARFADDLDIQTL